MRLYTENGIQVDLDLDLVEEALDYYIDESYINTVPDIYYNKEKFDNGNINLCFITGFSGSGKSTMGEYLNKKNNVENYDLDKVLFNAFTKDEEMKDNGPVYEAFFNGPGKKYRKYATEGDFDQFGKDYKKYSIGITNDFIDFIKLWANTHKDKKYVAEGVWIYRFVNPCALDNYAVYIKGTSLLTSSYRALKRNHEAKVDKNDKESGTGYHARSKEAARKRSIIKNLKKLKYDLCLTLEAEKYLHKYVEHFKDK